MNRLGHRASRWLRFHPSRLIVAPRVEVISTGAGGAEVAVRGLVCGICAVRTRAALIATLGVKDACVDLDAGTAALRLTPGTPVDVEAMQRSIDRVVVGLTARWAIERIALWLRAIHPRVVEGRGT